MKVQWTKGLKDKKSMEQLVYNSQAILERIQTILEEQRASIIAEQTKEANFESPSWSEKQAYQMGRLRELNELLSLVTIEEK